MCEVSNPVSSTCDGHVVYLRDVTACMLKDSVWTASIRSYAQNTVYQTSFKEFSEDEFCKG